MLDNGYSVLITINSFNYINQCNLECYEYHKKKYFVFHIIRKVFCVSIRFIWFCYVVCTQSEESCYKLLSAIVIYSALKVKL